MARFHATIATPLAPRDAFERMAAFDRAPEWDPATSASVRVGDAAGIGAAFDVTTRFGGKTHVIRYTTTAWDPPSRFVLEAALPNGIGLRDEITVAAADGPGALVTYDARILPTGAWRLADPVFWIVFRRIGARAVPGMRRYLQADTAGA